MSETDAGNALRTDERLIRWLDTLGWKGRLVPIRHLRDLREAIVGRHARGEFDESFYREHLGSFSFDAPPELPDASALLVIAVATPPMRVFFRWQGSRRPAVLPPTYVRYSARTESVQEVASRWLAEEGFRAAKARVPLKALAVSSGIAEYGRNNLCYVPGMGSYLQLAGLFTDVPCPDDPWRSPTLMARCARCDACLERCPTGAIAEDRTLLHTERCLTLHNESDADFPAWLQPSWHDCLVGCMQCQARCPENAAHARWIEDRGEFSEEVTGILLERVTPERLPEALAARLRSLGLSFDSGLLGRNLAALLAAREARAS